MVTGPLFVARVCTFCLIGSLLSSCSLLIKVDQRQCSGTSECQALGPAFAGSTCQHGVCVLEQPTAAGGEGAGGASDGATDDPLTCESPAPNASEKVIYSFAPIFLAGAEPQNPKPFSVKACNQLDFECEHPLVGPIEVEAGRPYDFELPKGSSGFSGFFQIENPDTLSGLLFMGRPIVEDTVGWNVTLASPDLVTQLALLTRQEVDPELGIILSVARDCHAQALEGVTITNSKGGLGYYFVQNIPDTSLDRTGPQGAAGFANVPILPTSLSGMLPSGKELGPVNVRVKPHFISFAELFP
jgi:hypothetical protein